MNVEKFEELLLYVAEKSADDPNFGATKLNKLLFFSDFFAYAQLGRPITGARYQKLARGPAPREIMQVQQYLVQRGDAVIQTRERFGLVQKRLIPLRRPRLSIFTPEEIALVDEVVDELWDQSAARTSAISHDQMVGWQIVGMGEDIPYHSVFLSAEPLTAADIERGRQIAAEHGWLANG